jgi:hypothetical protein
MEITLTWLGCEVGSFAPGWQGTYEVQLGEVTEAVMVSLNARETRGFARALGQRFLNKNQADVILQNAGKEAIDAYVGKGKLPNRIFIRKPKIERPLDLKKWGLIE